MRKIVWSVQAAEDLKTIYHFYEVHNRKAARSIYKRIRKETKRLAQYPYMAAIEILLIDEPAEYRSLVVLQKFKVIYVVENDKINIAHVWDCRQDPALLQHR
ncbi:MAG: type II toxin-antitoxin system RelE/ParE family toxin [Tannerellaceae bacterium]|nr:type II toxin-antitoxin system RelE/ParE family toxin [Tannerellaceae bacterium]